MQRTFEIEDQENLFMDMMKFLDESKIDDKIVIYINTLGGPCWKFHSILNRLEEMKEEGYKITMRCLFAASMGFDIFYRWTGDKKLDWEAEGVIHIEATEQITWNGVLRSNSVVQRGRFVNEKDRKQVDYPFFTDQERKDYLNGLDIYIDPDRMKSIFNLT